MRLLPSPSTFGSSRRRRIYSQNAAEDGGLSLLFNKLCVLPFLIELMAAPLLCIPAYVFLHMCAPVFFGMVAAVQMPFMVQLVFTQAGFHLLRFDQFLVVVAD